MVRDSPARAFSIPEEEVLHTFCKQILKSRLFRGFYKERRYVDAVCSYRDLVVLHPSEKDLNHILQDIRTKLSNFYRYRPESTWIGITKSQLGNGDYQNVCIWVELDELAFGQYWFSVKAIRFRENEVIIKVKPIRPVDIDNPLSKNIDGTMAISETSINLNDFQKIAINWGNSIKHTIYEFMSNDISKENFKSILKFFSLIIISLLSGAVQAVKFIGVFTIHFMIEFRKLLVVTTPIIMRIIDLCSKIVGGFYILVAMIWRDATGGNKKGGFQQNAIVYERPVYQSIEYKDKLSQKNIRL